MLKNICSENSVLNITRISARIFLLFCVLFALNGCVNQPVQDSAALLPDETVTPEKSVNAADIDSAVNTDETADDTATTTEKVVANDTENDIWQRIRNGFALPAVDNKRITQELNWYVHHPEYLKRVVERARPYMHYIIKTVEQAGIPSEIALLPIVESAFQPFAYSHGRAAGIWQFIPSTGKRYGLKQNWWYDGRRDVYESTKSAIKLLKRLNENFDGDWTYALAAYNTGDRRVKHEIRRNKRRGKPTDFFSLNLPKETRAYVPKLLALKRIINHPENYDIELDKIPDEPYFEQVELDSQIDLGLAAELAGMDLDDLYRLNSGYNRWATAPNGPYDLLLPVSQVEQFRENLEELPPQKRIHWKRHLVREGETLSTIAQKFHTSISTIKRINHIRGKFIRAGRGLTIPVASRSLREYTLSKTQRRNKLQNIPREGRKVSYVVKEGDTFWDLARYHRVGVRQLAKWNSMAPRDRLQAGQKLIIWSRRGSETLSSNSVENLSAPPHRSIIKRIGYRVRHGDSLARISSKFRVSIAQLKSWNVSLRNKKYLQPGMWLTLLVDVARQSGS